jgi:hypothetical protein
VVPVGYGSCLDSTGESTRAVKQLLAVFYDVKIGRKVREKAALTPGYLLFSELEYPKRKNVIDQFLTSTEVRIFI